MFQQAKAALSGAEQPGTDTPQWQHGSADLLEQALQQPACSSGSISAKLCVTSQTGI